MAYVGPVDRYDFMGATQFRLLCTLGLRMNHCLLDFGCGSLRAGKLFISYLDKCNYYGIEPNKWLIEEGIRNQVGQDLISIKKPTFDYNENFSVDVLSAKFDFILAQSIFSHTGIDLITTALRNLKDALKEEGLILATFIEGKSDFTGKGWVYPSVVSFTPKTIIRFGLETGLIATRIPWYHPNQTWYIFAKDRSLLPSPSMFRYLNGAVLFDPQFRRSCQRKNKRGIVHFVKQNVPHAIKKRIKNTIRSLHNL